MAGSRLKWHGLSFEACQAKMFNLFHARSSCLHRPASAPGLAQGQVDPPFAQARMYAGFDR